MAVYAVSDLHGRYDLFKQIKEYINPEDVVYILGDCNDRGPDGWKIIKEVYDDPQFIYIIGNHELLLVDAMEGNLTLSRLNGGMRTYFDWKYDGQDTSWIKKLKSLSLEERYINQNGIEVILCHAGYTPHKNFCISEDDYVWGREHFYDNWDMIDYPNSVLVHGHTPLPYFKDYFTEYQPQKDLKAYWYCEDENGIYHKVNIDCGAVFTGTVSMLDLDTFKSIEFKGVSNETK